MKTTTSFRHFRTSAQSGFRALESFAVFACGDSNNSLKGSAHRIGRFKAAGVRDLFQSHGRAMDHLLRSLNAQAIDELARIHLHLAETYPRKVSWAHPYSRGESFHGKIGLQIFEHINL